MVNFLRKLNLWVILCTFLAYAAPFVSPASVSLLLFAGLAYPWLLLLNLIFIALWAISRYRYWWFSTATVLIGWTYLTGIFGIHFFKNTEGSRSPQTLRVLTYNLNDLSLRSIKNKFDGRQQFNAFIEQQNADVMCLQEFDTKTTAIQKQIEFLPILTTYPYI